MFIPHLQSLKPTPRLAYTDYTPPGPWSDGQSVVRNYDGVGFTYSASLNALSIIPNQSNSTKDSNSNKIINVPDPTNNLDAANKEYVDTHAGSGGGGTPSTAIPLMDGVGAAGTATPYSREDHVHPSDTTKAPLASPALTGTPTAPTVTPGTDSTTKIATTAFVQSAVAAVSSGVTNVTAGTGLTGGGSGAVTIAVATNGVTNALAAQMAANTLKGNNTGATANAVDLTVAQTMTLLGAAPLASPTFTGTPAAPTPATADNTTKIATTAYVQNQGYATTASLPPPSSVTPNMDGTGSAGIATAYARSDHIHPSDTSRAPLASPAFTGTPTSTTPATVDNTTKIATTAYVQAQGYATSGSIPSPSSTTPIVDGTGTAGVSANYSRGDHVHPTDTSRAPLASPTFTGTPAAPTPAGTDNSTTLATTAYVKGQGYLTGNQTVTLSGDISGSGTTAITTTLPTVNANVGTFQGITVNGKGLVTGAVNQSYLTGNQSITLSGDITGSGATAITATLATVNANVGTFQGITVNGKGLVTGAVSQVGTANPLMNGSVAVGTSLLYSRQDHVHPVDTSRAPNTVFVASGASHSTGLVPDPGATAGTTRFLREDATWQTAGGGAVYIQDTAPASPSAGSLWWQSSTGQLFIYYNDGTSSQWVSATTPASGAALQVVRGQIAGLNVTPSTTSYSISAGQAADSNNVDYINLASALSKTTSAWAAGNGNGGLDTGTIAASTGYHNYVIKNVSTQAVDSTFSLSASAPALPSGYTEYRRIGSLKTNASSQFVLFTQNGDEILLKTPIQESGTPIATGAGSGTLTISSVPSGVQVYAKIVVALSYSTAACYMTIYSPDMGTQTAGSPGGYYQLSVNINTGVVNADLTVRTNTTQNLGYAASAAGSSIYIICYGWIDRRGRDA
jgi:hypothetical protein